MVDEQEVEVDYDDDEEEEPALDDASSAASDSSPMRGTDLAFDEDATSTSAGVPEQVGVSSSPTAEGMMQALEDLVAETNHAAALDLMSPQQPGAPMSSREAKLARARRLASERDEMDAAKLGGGR